MVQSILFFNRNSTKRANFYVHIDFHVVLVC